MRPVAVVVVDVDPKHVLELPLADDQDPIEAVAPDGADPALGERVRARCAKRRANDLDALTSEDLIEGVAELAVSIVDQKAERPQPLFGRPGELPGLLSYPGAARVGGAASQMYPPAAQLDKEEHVEASEPERVDGEEIAGDHGLCVRTKELTPAQPSPRLGRRDTGLAQDGANRRRGHVGAHTGELADDPLIAPTRILTSDAQH